MTVLDCETTGVYRSDRIVEIAIVTLDLDGQVIDSWDTLVHPQRDVSASWIHGLTAASVRDAPTFADIAGDVALRLDGSCVAAHNLPFDTRMIANEFDRLGAELSVLAGIDTLSATSCRLSVACDRYGIELRGAHTALADATATAELLAIVAGDCAVGAPVAAPTHLMRSGRIMRRSDARPVELPDPPHLAALLASLDHAGVEASVLAYLEVVDRALADLHLDAHERLELREIAEQLGLDDARVHQAHRRFVNGLVRVALSDDIVTDEELDMCLRVATALGIDTTLVEERTVHARNKPLDVILREAMAIVFTGDDPIHARDDLRAHAETLGLVVQTGVTKQTSILVPYDPESGSGKAAKARKYGIPVVSTSDFARARLGDSVLAKSAGGGRKVTTCSDCLTTWTVDAATGRRSVRRCSDCDGISSRQVVVAATATSGAHETASTTETLQCLRCGKNWIRERARGRKPHQCPECTRTS